MGQIRWPESINRVVVALEKMDIEQSAPVQLREAGGFATEFVDSLRTGSLEVTTPIFGSQKKPVELSPVRATPGEGQRAR